MSYSTKRLNIREVSSDPEVRSRVLSSYNNMCAASRVYYSKELPVKCKSKRLLEIDHILELHLDGLDVEDNLQPLCKTCHYRKTYLNKEYQTTQTYIWFDE